MIIPESYNASWNNFMTSDRLSELSKIEQLIGTDYTPEADKVLQFMQLDLSKMKVVILGQDPYKPAGVANGRSFQPNDLESWGQTFRQVSLKNIIRAIYAMHNNIDEYSDIPSYSNITWLMETGKLGIKSPKEWFNSLEDQGVLFLNTSLTCKIGASNSHREIWYKFGQELVHYISIANPSLCWFLWGKDAISCKEHIASGKLYISRHPMMCSESYPDDFLRNPCFKETSDIINWLG